MKVASFVLLVHTVRINTQKLFIIQHKFREQFNLQLCSVSLCCSHICFKSCCNWLMVSAGEVTACPIVRGSVYMLWSLPPGSVLSPKKWISSNVSFSKWFKQYVLSHPFGNTSKLICPPAKITLLWRNWKQRVSELNKLYNYYMLNSLLLFQTLMITHFNATVSAFSGWVTRIGTKTCLVVQKRPSCH